MSEKEITSNSKKSDKTLLIVAIIYFLPFILFMGEIWVPTRIYYSNTSFTCHQVKESILVQRAMSAGPGATAPSFYKTFYGDNLEYTGIQKFKKGEVICVKFLRNRPNRILAVKEGTSLLGAIYYYSQNPLLVLTGIIMYFIFFLALIIGSLLMLIRLYAKSIHLFQEIRYSTGFFPLLNDIVKVLKDVIFKTIILGIIIGLIIIFYKGFLIVESLPSIIIGLYLFVVLVIICLPKPYSVDSIIQSIINGEKNKFINLIKDIAFILGGVFLLRKITMFYLNMEMQTYNSMTDLISDLLCFILNC